MNYEKIKQIAQNLADPFGEGIFPHYLGKEIEDALIEAYNEGFYDAKIKARGLACSCYGPHNVVVLDIEEMSPE